MSNLEHVALDSKKLRNQSGFDRKTPNSGKCKIILRAVVSIIISLD